MSTVVSVRVRKQVKDELERAGVDVAGEIRKQLEDLAWKVRTKGKLEKWRGVLAEVEPSRKGFAARSVREDRESH